MSDILKLIEKLKFIRDYECRTRDEINAMNDAITELSAQPERKKGKWIKGGEQPYFRKHFDIVVCSVCNKRGERRWNFCPNCGADMRGGRADG